MTCTMRPRRGEIWRVRFDPSVGAEIQKDRPAVVVQVEEVGCLPVVIVVPVTEWDSRYACFPWHTKIPCSSLNGLDKDSSADSVQVKSVSVTRFIDRIGEVTPDQPAEIVAAIALCIGFTGSID